MLSLKNISPYTRSQKGIALVTTLIITAILVAVLAEFAFSIYISTARAGNFKDSSRAGLLAEDGVNFARAALEELLIRKSELTMGEDGLSFTKQTGEDSAIEIKVVDELSKDSLKVAYSATGLLNDNVDGEYARLLKALGLNERLKESLADWIDQDSEERQYGAEAGEYQRLSKPYKPKNGDLDSTDELLLIKGYTPEVYKKLSPYVSPYNPDGLVNINTAGKTVIKSLADGITDELADKVISFRKSSPFKDKSDIMKVPGFEKIGFSLQDRITTQTNIFRIISKAHAGDAVREVEAVVLAGGGVLYWRER